MSSSLPNFSGRYVNQYLLTSLLGSGAGGCVYRAIDTSSKHHRSYAIKCMSKVDLPTDQMLQQIIEISVHYAVTGSSSYVLSLRDVIEDDFYTWVVLDLCEGGDLFKAIWRTKVFHGNDPLIKQTFLEILDGVSACHQQQVFHRDLKPENILCNANGTGIRIADFGAATGERLCRGVLCGTGPYMSPEYWVGHENNITVPLLVDIWSLGIILINMVTSCFPWEVAHPSDDGFQAFLDEEDYFLTTFPISRRLNSLLKGILNPRSHRRMSIPQIRRAIVEMETFYRKPTLRRAAWSREVVFKQEEDLGSYTELASYLRADTNIRKPQAVHAGPELPVKVWGPVRELWVDGMSEIVPAAKVAGRRLI